jgi:high frequency lysogenization protein
MSVDDEVMALAGLFQAARLVVRLARHGQCDPDAYAVSVGSILHLDPESAAGVYGDPAGVRCGLEGLIEALDARVREAEATRIVVTVMHLERKLAARPDLLATLRAGIEQAARSATTLGVGDDSVSERLGALYAETLSTLRPRVMVPGSVLHLEQPRTVARIRTLLLASVRAAVLWRQVGGTRWGLLLRRGRICEASRRLHARALAPT